MRKIISVTALSASLIGGAAFGASALGPVLAGAQDSGTATTEATTTDAAPDHGARLSEVLQPLVDDGTISADQRDAVVAALVAAAPDRRPGHGPGRGPPWETAAAALGIDADTLRDDLRSGQSIADVAGELGVDPQTVIDALVAEANARIDAKVADGDLTAEEGAERKADAVERITAMVQGDWPEGGPHGGRRHGFPGGPRGWSDGGTDDAPAGA